MSASIGSFHDGDKVSLLGKVQLMEVINRDWKSSLSANELQVLMAIWDRTVAWGHWYARITRRDLLEGTYGSDALSCSESTLKRILRSFAKRGVIIITQLPDSARLMMINWMWMPEGVERCARRIRELGKTSLATVMEAVRKMLRKSKKYVVELADKFVVDDESYAEQQVEPRQSCVRKAKNKGGHGEPRGGHDDPPTINSREKNSNGAFAPDTAFLVDQGFSDQGSSDKNMDMAGDEQVEPGSSSAFDRVAAVAAGVDAMRSEARLRRASVDNSNGWRAVWQSAYEEAYPDDSVVGAWSKKEIGQMRTLREFSEAKYEDFAAMLDWIVRDWPRIMQGSFRKMKDTPPRPAVGFVVKLRLAFIAAWNDYKDDGAGRVTKDNPEVVRLSERLAEYKARRKERELEKEFGEAKSLLAKDKREFARKVAQFRKDKDALDMLMKKTGFEEAVISRRGARVPISVGSHAVGKPSREDMQRAMLLWRENEDD